MLVPKKVNAAVISPKTLSSKRNYRHRVLNHFPLYLLYLWQCKVKGSTLSLSTFGPDFSAMAVDNASYIRKTNPCAFTIVLRMKTMEYSEELIRIFHVKTHSIVDYGTGEFVTFFFACYLDFGPGTSACELDCIGDKIGHHKS
jgi:hypothetical protein